MKIEYVQKFENTSGEIGFKTENDGLINITTYNDGTIYVTADNVTLDELLEAIEMVKSGKLVIEL